MLYKLKKARFYVTLVTCEFLCELIHTDWLHVAPEFRMKRWQKIDEEVVFHHTPI